MRQPAGWARARRMFETRSTNEKNFFEHDEKKSGSLVSNGGHPCAGCCLTLLVEAMQLCMCASILSESIGSGVQQLALYTNDECDATMCQFIKFSSFVVMDFAKFSHCTTTLTYPSTCEATFLAHVLNAVATFARRDLTIMLTSCDHTDLPTQKFRVKMSLNNTEPLRETPHMS